LLSKNNLVIFVILRMVWKLTIDREIDGKSINQQVIEAMTNHLNFLYENDSYSCGHSNIQYGEWTLVTRKKKWGNRPRFYRPNPNCAKCLAHLQ